MLRAPIFSVSPEDELKSLSPRVRILLLIVVPALAYAASLGGDFLYDDVDLVEKNRFVRDLSSLPEYIKK